MLQHFPNFRSAIVSQTTIEMMLINIKRDYKNESKKMKLRHTSCQHNVYFIVKVASSGGSLLVSVNLLRFPFSRGKQHCISRFSCSFFCFLSVIDDVQNKIDKFFHVDISGVPLERSMVFPFEIVVWRQRDFRWGTFGIRINMLYQNRICIMSLVQASQSSRIFTTKYIL